MTTRLPIAFLLTAAVLAAAAFVTTGCDGRPSEDENQQARADVSHATTPVQMNSSRINDMIAAAKAGNAGDAFKGTTFAVTGKIKQTHFEETSDGAGTKRTLMVVIENPDYAAVEMSCYFPAGDEQKVRQLKPDARVTIRGKFRNATGIEISLDGCMFAE